MEHIHVHVMYISLHVHCTRNYSMYIVPHYCYCMGEWKHVERERERDTADAYMYS